LALADEGIAFAERRGVSGVARWARGERTWKLYDLGRWDELLERGYELLDADRADGGTQVSALVAPFVVRVHVRRGEPQRAEAISEGLLERARAIGDTQVLAPALGAGALLEAARGNLAAAARLAAELHERTADQSFWPRALMLPELVRLCLRTDEHELAVQVAGGSANDPRSRNAVASAAALLEEDGGDLAQAAELHRDAAAAWHAYGCVPEQADALAGAARCLDALGGDGSGDLDAANALYAELGIRPSAKDDAAASSA
jgi:hypothetical protein